MPRECKRNGNQLSILFREDQFYFFFLLFYFIRKLNERERERVEILIKEKVYYFLFMLNFLFYLLMNTFKKMSVSFNRDDSFCICTYITKNEEKISNSIPF